MKNLIQAMKDAFIRTSVPADLTPQARQTLDLLTEEFEIPASWGIRDITGLEDGLLFTVSGFLFNGTVGVVESDGTYDVTLTSPDGRQKTYVWIGRDELVSTIDALVEKDADYKARIRKEYGVATV